MLEDQVLPVHERAEHDHEAPEGPERKPALGEARFLVVEALFDLQAQVFDRLDTSVDLGGIERVHEHVERHEVGLGVLGLKRLIAHQQDALTDARDTLRGPGVIKLGVVEQAGQLRAALAGQLVTRYEELRVRGVLAGGVAILADAFDPQTGQRRDARRELGLEGRVVVVPELLADLRVHLDQLVGRDRGARDLMVVERAARRMAADTGRHHGDRAVDAFEEVVFNLLVAAPADMPDIGEPGWGRAVGTVTCCAFRRAGIAVFQDVLAVDALAVLVGDFGRQIVVFHKGRVGVAAATGPRDVAEEHVALGVGGRQHIVCAVAVDAHGHRGVAVLPQSPAVSAHPVLGQLVRAQAVGVHTLDVGVAGAAEHGHVGPRRAAPKRVAMVEGWPAGLCGCADGRDAVLVRLGERDLVDVLATVALGAA